MTSVDRWIGTREPAPPAALRNRMEGVLVPGDAFTPASAIDGAIGLLESLRTDPDRSRSAALTLLTADALMTYAFEAAAEDPDSLETLAVAAIERIARTADGADR